MKVRVQRWGNSLAVRIPKAFAEETHLEQDTLVDITLQEGGLAIRPVTRSKPTLEDLLARVTDENLHQEVDFGAPVGKEVW